MTNPVIPAMALGAAVNAWRNTPIGGDALMNALEAAAPHIIAQGWDEGWDASKAWELHPNPYRSAP